MDEEEYEKYYPVAEQLYTTVHKADIRRGQRAPFSKLGYGARMDYAEVVKAIAELGVERNAPLGEA